MKPILGGFFSAITAIAHRHAAISAKQPTKSDGFDSTSWAALQLTGTFGFKFIEMAFSYPPKGHTKSTITKKSIQYSIYNHKKEIGTQKNSNQPTRAGFRQPRGLSETCPASGCACHVNVCLEVVPLRWCSLPRSNLDGVEWWVGFP